MLQLLYKNGEVESFVRPRDLLERIVSLCKSNSEILEHSKQGAILGIRNVGEKTYETDGEKIAQLLSRVVAKENIDEVKTDIISKTIWQSRS